MATKLTTHFTLEELSVTEQRNLDNKPTPEIAAKLKTLAETILEPARALIGPIHVNSGYRSPAVNKAIGGSKTSQHMQGEACDFFGLASSTLKEEFEKIRISNIPFDQLIYEFGRWIHISMAAPGKSPRKQVLMIGSWTNGKYEVYDASKAP